MKSFLQILTVLVFPILAVHVAVAAAVSPKCAKVIAYLFCCLALFSRWEPRMFAVPACHTTRDILIRDTSSSFMKALQSLGIGSVILAAAACAGIEQRQPLATVAFVDLSQYSGT